MKKKNTTKKIFYTILFLCIIPYNLNKIIPKLLANMIMYGIEFVILIYTLYLLTREKNTNQKEKRLINKTIIYFIFLILLNILAVLTNKNNQSYGIIIKRTASMLCVCSIIILTIIKNKDEKYIVIGLKNAAWILIIVSIVLYFFLPNIGRYYAGYNVYTFEGIADNRNGYIEFALLFLIALAYLDKDIFNTTHLLQFIITLVTIILTKSATSIIITAIFCVFLFFERIIKKKINYKMVFDIIIVVWALFFIILIINPNFSFISSFFNKSSTLSGRTILWEKGIEYIKDKPIIGYGYDNNVFKDTYSITYQRVFETNNVHNGVLDLLITTGVVGCVLTLYYLYSILQPNKKTELSNKNHYFLLYILACMVRGLTESCLFYSHVLLYIILILFNLSDNNQNEDKEIVTMEEKNESNVKDTERGIRNIKKNNNFFKRE